MSISIYFRRGREVFEVPSYIKSIAYKIRMVKEVVSGHNMLLRCSIHLCIFIHVLYIVKGKQANVDRFCRVTIPNHTSSIQTFMQNIMNFHETDLKLSVEGWSVDRLLDRHWRVYNNTSSLIVVGYINVS